MMTREELETAKQRRAWRMEGKEGERACCRGFPGICRRCYGNDA